MFGQMLKAALGRFGRKAIPEVAVFQGGDGIQVVVTHDGTKHFTQYGQSPNDPNEHHTLLRAWSEDGSGATTDVTFNTTPTRGKSLLAFIKPPEAGQGNA